MAGPSIDFTEKPIIRNITITPSYNPTQFSGMYVENVTTINVVAEVNYGNGASVKECVIEYCFTGDDNRTFPATGTTATFKVGKSSSTTLHKIRVTARNDFGKAVSSKEFYVTPYDAPTLTIDNERYGSNAVKVLLKGSVDPVGGKNTKSLSVMWRNVGSTGGFYKRDIAISTWDFDTYAILSGIPADQSVEIIAELTDAAMTETAHSQNGRVTISRYAGGKGVTFFKEAEQEGFWIKNFNFDIPQETIEVLKTNYLAGALVESKGFATEANTRFNAIDANMNDLSQRVVNLESDSSGGASSKITSIGGIGTGECIYIGSLNLAFVRMYYTPQTVWTPDDNPPNHNVGYVQGSKPSAITALACHSGNGVYTAKIETDGTINVFAKIPPSSAKYTIYVSGIFHYDY